MPNPATQSKYRRIQQFHKVLRGYGCFHHQFVEDVICKFFHITGSTTLARILSEPTEEGQDFEDADLDIAWIKLYLEKHLKSNNENEKFESEPVR